MYYVHGRVPLLVEEGGLECVALNECRENRLAFHTVPIGDSTRTEFNLTDDRGWECGVWRRVPPYDFGRGWPDTNRELARRWPTR